MPASVGDQLGPNDVARTDLQQGPRELRLAALVRRRARVDQPAAARQSTDLRSVAVAEDDDVRPGVRVFERPDRALLGAPARPQVAVRDADADAVELDDLAGPEAAEELRPVVVAGDAVDRGDA